jgi:hypothetical protein
MYSMADRSKESIGTARHAPTFDAEKINRAVEKADEDPDFVDYAIGQLGGLRFPAFKQGIVDYAKDIGADDDVVALFSSLNGYIEFRDQYHLYKSLQENIASKKKEFQMSDGTRQNPDVRTRETGTGASIKDREAVNKSEERKDYPEVTPTAMSNFVCNRCGKQFQNQDDLVHHRQFEGGTVT